MKTLESKLRLLPITEREAKDKGGEISATERMVNSEKEMGARKHGNLGK